MSQIVRMESNEIPRTESGGRIIVHSLQRSGPIGDKLEIQLALVYCINTETYSRYLKTNNLI